MEVTRFIFAILRTSLNQNHHANTEFRIDKRMINALLYKASRPTVTRNYPLCQKFISFYICPNRTYMHIFSFHIFFLVPDIYFLIDWVI